MSTLARVSTSITVAAAATAVLIVAGTYGLVVLASRAHD